MRGTLAIVALLSMAACDPVQQVVVYIDADTETRANVRRLEVEVYRGDRTSANNTADTQDREEWPGIITVTPGDSNEDGFIIRVRGRAADSSLYVEQSRPITFIPGSGTIYMPLRSECARLSCAFTADPATTCLTGVCEGEPTDDPLPWSGQPPFSDAGP